MGANSKIEWTDHTFNPWLGCTHVSQGCEHCYAEAMMEQRLRRVVWGAHGERRRTSDANWRQVIHWNRKAGERGERHRVFCASLADVFDDHPSIAQEWRRELWDLIAATPHLDWLLLTKRPEHWPHFLPTIEPSDRFRHVRLGVTIEHDRTRPMRAEMLCIASHLGWPTFISYEPAIGPVDWSFLSKLTDTWLIAGGESGREARPPHPDWFRAARDAAAQHAVPYFFKQWGEYAPTQRFGDKRSCAIDIDGKLPPGDPSTDDGIAEIMESVVTGDYTFMSRYGKKAAGRLLDGIEHNAFPPPFTGEGDRRAAAAEGARVPETA